MIFEKLRLARAKRKDADASNVLEDAPSLSTYRQYDLYEVSFDNGKSWHKQMLKGDEVMLRLRVGGIIRLPESAVSKVNNLG